jgi:glycosyltransferase involved in cell wall biosynthesis
LREIDLSSYPLVSIIIATYNAERTLSFCIKSNLNQSYPNKEIIVIDGGSSDGTIGILQSFDSKILNWISEIDTGIYNAWNKALDMANGQWVCFLGADDYWSGDDSLFNLMTTATPVVDLVVSRGSIVNKNGTVGRTLGRPWNWKHMKHWQCVIHPGLLHNRNLFQKFGKFNERYSIAADYDFLLRLGDNIHAVFLDKENVCIGAGGKSQKQIGLVLKEVRDIQQRHFEIGPVKAFLNFCIAHTKVVLRRGLWEIFSLF